MKNILTVVKKELSRVFKDKKLILLLIFPGILLYAMYSIMGGAINNLESGDGETYVIYAIYKESENVPSNIKAVFDDASLNIKADYFTALESDIESIENDIKEAKIDLFIKFEGEFNGEIDEENIPDIYICYNPSEAKSSAVYNKVSVALSIYNQSVLAANDIPTQALNITPKSILNEQKAQGKILAMLVPLLMMSFLFSGSMAVAPESIAGEKERGTIATILVSPVKRHELALGKIIALSVLAAVSAASSFIGLILSLPKLVGMEFSAISYGFTEYLLLFLVLLATVLVIIGLMSVISCFAKTVKEASMLIMPLMLVVLGVGISSMFMSGAPSNVLLYLIPLYNSVISMGAIMAFEVNILGITLAVLSNLACTAIFIFVLTKLFNNEKVMFSK